MSTLSIAMEAIKAALAAKYPARVVTRDLLDFAQRAEADLTAGIYTVVSKDENDYTHTLGREASDGKHQIGLLCQIKVAEGLPPSAAEDAEGVMIDEIKAFLRSRTLLTNTLRATGFRQSRQLESPYGWVAFDLVRQGD
jgi:hypothetical protein